MDPITATELILSHRKIRGVESPGDERRSFISHLLDAGADIATVSRMAGNASMQSIARYDRSPEEVKRKVLELLHVPHKTRKVGPHEP